MKDQHFTVDTLLAELPLFTGAAPEEIGRIAEGTRHFPAPRGTILFNQGDPCESFHLVVYGQVKLALTSQKGAEKVVEIIGPGGTFGEALMFIGQPYIVYAQTLVDSLLLSVAKAVVLQEIERSPQFALKMIASLCQRLHGLVKDIEGQSLQSGTQRFIGYLLREDKEGGLAGGPFSVTLPASKTTIASRLNLTPEHFSRILRDLASRELISIDGRRVHVVDAEKLKAYGS